LQLVAELLAQVAAERDADHSFLRRGHLVAAVLDAEQDIAAVGVGQ